MNPLTAASDWLGKHSLKRRTPANLRECAANLDAKRAALIAAIEAGESTDEMEVVRLYWLAEDLRELADHREAGGTFEDWFNSTPTPGG